MAVVCCGRAPQIESGIPTTAEIYIAADAVREFLWWSHQYVIGTDSAMQATLRL